MTVTYDDGTTAAYPPETHRKLRLYNIPEGTLVEARKLNRKGVVSQAYQNQKVPFSAKFAKKVEQAEQGLRPLTEDDWHDSDSEEDDWCGMYEEGVDGETFC